jgi:hypothetical protein
VDVGGRVPQRTQPHFHILITDFVLTSNVFKRKTFSLQELAKKIASIEAKIKGI